MDQWNNPRQSYINQQENHYMMDTSGTINIMDMDASGPPRMVASDDIQIDCYNHDRIIERPMSPEVQKGRISPTYARQELAKKLLNRRSMGELRQQNYTSGLSPGFHDSRAKLQRAQTTDFLNKKINKRPDAESLVHNNILRTGNSSGTKYVDPSLISRQNELAKAQLGDGIKQHLETRPGPLELVQNNIMQLSEPLNNVIKSGQVAFKANSRHPSFNKYREHHSPENFYDSVQASPENALSPESQVSDDIGSYQDEVRLNDLGPPSNESTSSTSTRTKHSSGAKNSPKVRRKNQKAKVWKFKYHEYKPPGSRDKDKNSADKSQKNETPHEIIMKQQQLLLQLQVMQKNYPNYILPKTLDLLNELKEKSGNTAPSESHLNDMKVSALKEELKKRNLHTYGNKSQLVERLRPYVDKDISSASPSSANRSGKDPLQRSNSEGDMLASPDNLLSQPQRKTSQPVLSMEEAHNSGGLRNSHIPPGGLVNSNPSSNDVLDENCSIIDNLGSLMVESQDEYSNHGSHGSMHSEDLYGTRPTRNISSEQPPSYQEATNQFNPTSYSQLLSEQQHVEVPQPMMGQQPPPQTQQPGLQQQYIQQFPGQQVHGVITSQHQLNNSNQQRPQFQYSTQPQQQTNYQEMIPISQVQEMIPIPQVQPINTNNMYFNMQTQFRASNPPTAPANHQVVQLTSQPQYMIIQQQQQQHQQQQQQNTQPLSQQFTSRNEQYAVVPPQYLNTSLQQLRQVQQPRHVQQQVHQQRLNTQYQAGPAQHQQPAPDSLPIDNKLDNKNNISTPDVISIILGSPNTTPMLKKGDKVGDPFNTQPSTKEEPQPVPQIPQFGGRFNQTSDRRMLERQVLDRQVVDKPADRQMSTDDWLGANMPQDLLTPDTAHFSKLVTPGGESVFEFANDHLLNNTCNNDQLLMSSRPATSQGCEVTSWAVT